MPNCSIRHPLAAAGGLVVALLLVACSNSSGSSGGAAPTSRGSTSPAAAAARPDRGPAASGTIAAIAGHVMQVQNQQTGQVAVKWTSATTFSHEVSVSAAKVVVGSCVVASATTGSGSSFTATRVILSPATGGQCGGGAFPGGGNRPAGRLSGGPPSGFPGGASGAARPRNLRPGAGGSFAVGRVTARSGDTLTVAMRSFGASASTTRTVKLAASTKVYEQAGTTAKSLAVGRCVTAQGEADSSGTVTATRVQVSLPINGSCTGFTRVGRGG